MNPWLIGGGVLAALAFFASRSSSASSDQMVFKDYAWVTSLPTYTGAGGDAANPVAAQLPQPPNVTATGHWHPYPGGWFVEGVTSSNAQFTHAAPGQPVFQEWPNVPHGVTVWMWIPNIGTDVHGTVNITKVNGYWISYGPWNAAVSAQEAAGMGADPAKLAHFQSATGPISPTNRWLEDPGGFTLPVPPGESGHSGKWGMKHPGYYVWITPQNSQKGDAEAAAQALSASAAPGLSTPSSAGVPAAAAQSGLPQPSTMPIATTP